MKTTNFISAGPLAVMVRSGSTESLAGVPALQLKRWGTDGTLHYWTRGRQGQVTIYASETIATLAIRGSVVYRGPVPSTSYGVVVLSNLWAEPPVATSSLVDGVGLDLASDEPVTPASGAAQFFILTENP